MNINRTEIILKISATIISLLLIGGIIFISIDTSEDRIMKLYTRSSNPEYVISPVNEQLNNTSGRNTIKNSSILSAIEFENLILNWQNLFDIFSYNLIDTVKTCESEDVNRDIVRNIKLRSDRKFFKGSSDAILTEYGNLIIEECSYYNIDWRLVLAIIKQESAFRYDAVSHAGAYGFMQIMPKTGSMLEKTLMIDDHRSPTGNLRAGIYYFAMLVGRYHEAGEPDKYMLALAAYNAGSGRVEDAMSIAYYNNENYLKWDIVREYLKLLGPENDSLHRAVWGTRPPNGIFTNWREPYYYVENIMWYWEQYKKLYPVKKEVNTDNKKGKKRK